jgi:hypothetical protein
MIYDIDGNPPSDLEDDLNRVVPKQDNPDVGRGLFFGIIFGALVWAVIVFLLGEFFS